jgi:hypothetical protein
MKTFAFRLERILQWRITSLKTEEMRIEKIRFRLELARVENEKLVQVLLRAKQSTGNQTPVKGADLHALDSYTIRLAAEIALAEKKMSALSDAIEKQMLVVSDCDRNVRLLERLRDRRREDWQTEMNRELDALSADFSGGRWLRGRRDAQRLGGSA